MIAELLLNCNYYSTKPQNILGDAADESCVKNASIGALNWGIRTLNGQGRRVLATSARHIEYRIKPRMREWRQGEKPPRRVGTAVTADCARLTAGATRYDTLLFTKNVPFVRQSQ